MRNEQGEKRQESTGLRLSHPNNNKINKIKMYTHIDIINKTRVLMYIHNKKIK